MLPGGFRALGGIWFWGVFKDFGVELPGVLDRV